jgi:hypothetical protein
MVFLPVQGGRHNNARDINNRRSSFTTLYVIALEPPRAVSVHDRAHQKNVIPDKHGDASDLGAAAMRAVDDTAANGLIDEVREGLERVTTAQMQKILFSQ